MIRVSSLFGGYGGWMIVEDVSFIVEKGEFVGIFGLNGLGKIILMKLLMGVFFFLKGEVFAVGKFIGRYKLWEFVKIMVVLLQYME